jgi:hypothetical protein
MPPLETDGFHLETRPDAEGRMFIVGQSPSGVVAGVGRLLRLARYADGSLTIPAVSLTDAPKMPVRGIYFATHFNNFYHVAPLEEVDRIVADFALWGGNSLTVWFDMHHYKGLDDPAAQAHLARLKHLGETARGLGMQFGLAFLANEAYSTSPQDFRARWIPGWSHYHVEVCPSKPEGLALIGKWQAQELDSFPAVDFIWTWPYDQGGCACDRCMPWGANGFLRASEQLARLYHERFPNGKVWLSTWLFDAQPGSKGDYDGFFRFLRETPPSWMTGITSDTTSIPKRLAERPTPERYPATCFPEISMYQMNPWGGYGANPLPDYCTRQAAPLADKIIGGWPYSEGIYEDVNKFFWCRFYWRPGQTTDGVLAEYASYYLSPEVAGDAVRLMHLLEKTHPRSKWRVRNLAEADEAWALAQAIDARLAPWAKTSWRWRIIYVRAAIDHILKNQGYLSDEAHAALAPLCDELVRIYHAQRTGIRPAAFQKPPSGNTANRAYGCPVTVSSSHPDYGDSGRRLVDGVLAEDDPENFWVHDPPKEKTAWVLLDLGKTISIKEAQLQFRGIYGVFWFVPTSVSFEVSEDGKQFKSVSTSQAVPKEGAPYSPRFWSYPIGKPARYLRVTLGPSQHVGKPFPGTLELTEIQVFGQ